MIEFQVEGMTCQHCVAAITQAVQRVASAARIEVDLPSGRVRVASNGRAEPFEAAIAEAGYTVKQTATSPASRD
ncbi:heavy-metal-associated domain-containing protein [Trinickia sp. LjRoot230]|uniref:heavy-metal-associated domain-containing protein n=1 Tax=Trinickia sp. LjRoot230 TaxID=3342288 RepID=UPI003ECF84F8